jgi:hypothetical protein
MKTWILHRTSLIAILSLGAAAASIGCDGDDADKAGGGTRDVGDRSADAVKRGIDKGGAAADSGIDAAHDATTQAVDQTKDAPDSARTAVGEAARESGATVRDAGEAVDEFVSRASRPPSPHRRSEGRPRRDTRWSAGKPVTVP